MAFSAYWTVLMHQQTKPHCNFCVSLLITCGILIHMMIISKTIVNNEYVYVATLQSSEFETTNITYSVPALWVVGPPKTATQSLIPAMVNSFVNWTIPFNNYGRPSLMEKNDIWLDFELNYYSKANIKQFYDLMIQNISIIVFKKLENYTSLNDFGFDELILTLLNNIRPFEAMVKDRILNKQNKEFKYGLNESKSNKNIVSIQKSPTFACQPLIPIIFTHWISSINYKTNMYGSKILIMLRDPTKRIISLYSMHWASRFIKKYNRKHPTQINDKINNLIGYQLLTVPMKYEPLNIIKEMIINRKNELDDIFILTQYFKLYYEFKKLLQQCIDSDWKYNKCKHIDICLYKCWIDRKHPYGNRYLTVTQPIYMIFTGIFYPHLLLNLYLFKKHNLLSTKFRFMSFDYLIHNPKKAMYLLKCWTENISDKIVCNDESIEKFKRNNKNVWDKISLPKTNSWTLNVSINITNELNMYFDPIIPQINELLNRYNKNYDIFVGEWDGNIH